MGKRYIECSTCNGTGVDLTRLVTSDVRWDCAVCDGTRHVEIDTDDTDMYANPGSEPASGLASPDPWPNEKGDQEEVASDETARRYAEALRDVNTWQASTRQEAQRQEHYRAPTPMELGHHVLDLVGALSSSEGGGAMSTARTPSPADLEVAAENAKLFAEPPMWRAPRYQDAIAAQGLFGNPRQNLVMYQTIGVLPLVVAAPTVSTVGAGYFLLDGSHALVTGDYEHALRAFGTALALTPSNAALKWRAERSTQRVAWALQDELESTVIAHPRMRSSVTISVGVMSDAERAAKVVVSVVALRSH